MKYILYVMPIYPLDWIPVLGTYANNADIDQMPQNAASDQGLHCLVTKNSMQNTIKEKIFA